MAEQRDEAVVAAVFCESLLCLIAFAFVRGFVEWWNSLERFITFFFLFLFFVKTISHISFPTRKKPIYKIFFSYVY